MDKWNIVANAALLAIISFGSLDAAPIPISLIGTARLVNVSSSAQSIITGGSFNAHVGNPNLPGVDTHFWCIDAENYIHMGDTYLANITLVSQTAANPTLVRKGTQTSWEDGQGYTTQQRYSAAAYLIERIIAGDSGFGNDDLQRAIWRLTDAADINDETHPWFQNAPYAAAQSFIAGGGTTAHTWASVSGVVNADGALMPNNRRQTFLVQVESLRYDQSTVPEPGTYALIGSGLILLACLRRR